MHERGLFRKPSFKRVARVRHEVVDERGLLRRDAALRMAGQTDVSFDTGRPHVDVTVRKRARDDAIVVVRVPLGFHQSHPPAGRTALEVGVLRVAIVEGLDDLLRLDRHLVGRAVPEVDHLLRVPDRPGSTLFLVTRVCARGRVPEPQRLRHVVGEALNRAGKAAVADAHELPVPLVRRRKPHLHVDERIGCGFEDDLQAAVRRDHRRRLLAGCLHRGRWRHRPLVALVRLRLVRRPAPLDLVLARARDPQEPSVRW